MNSELQLGLIGLGVAGVGLVFAYNQWQERKHRKLAETLESQTRDVLLDGINHDPKAPPEKNTLSGMFYTDAYIPEKRPQTAPFSTLDIQSGGYGERVEPSMPAELTPPVMPPAQPQAAQPQGIAGFAAAQPAADPLAERLHIQSFNLSPENIPNPPATAIFETATGRPANKHNLDEVRQAPLQTFDRMDEAEGGTAHGFSARQADGKFISAPPRIPERLVSQRTECLVYFELSDLVSVKQIWQSKAILPLGQVSKSIYWVGYNEIGRRWEYFVNDNQTEYRYLCIGLQLADRNGPATDADFRGFFGVMQHLAEELMCVVELPRLQDIMTTAAQIDKFCAEVDMQIGLNLLGRAAPFSGTQLRAMAESAGMALDKRGRFCRRNEDGLIQFAIQDIEGKPFVPETLRQSSYKGLTFLVDVPRIDQGERVFNQMVDLAQRFGESLNAVLVDDNGHPLGLKQLEQIRQEYVMKPQSEMHNHGIPAGSPTALRLFVPA